MYMNTTKPLSLFKSHPEVAAEPPPRAQTTVTSIDGQMG
jgi:hypothetical protein